MTSNEIAVEKTKTWVNEIVIGLNLCPFAASPFHNEQISYQVISGDSLEQHLQQLADAFYQLDNTESIETSLLIFPDAYQQFENYLDLLELGNRLLEQLNYCGTYQLASFHPQYIFADSSEDDASNFSNRSPYPMFHLIREADLEKAIASYEHIEEVPKNNIKKLRKIGYREMQEKLKLIMSE